MNYRTLQVPIATNSSILDVGKVSKIQLYFIYITLHM